MSISQKFNNFLLQHRNCPHAVTGNFQDAVLMGRSLRCKLDLLKPDIGRKVQKSQNEKELSENSKPQMRHIDVGQAVLARSYGRRDPWVIGAIVKQTGLISFVVKVGHLHWKPHFNQLKTTELLLPEDEQ